MASRDEEKSTYVRDNGDLEARLPNTSDLGGAEQPDNDHAIPEQRTQAAWDGPDDLDNPLNWSSWRKVTIAMCVSLGQLITLMSASMIAAALPQISRDIGLGANAMQIAFSVFFLGLAVGPFPVAALSEMYGRKPVWIFCNCSYVLWNSLCPVGDNPGLLIVGRFLEGVSASVGGTLTGPILADMYPASQRGQSLAIAGALPYLGPALGPIIGGIVSQQIHWHWLFWVLSFFAAAVVAVGFFVIREDSPLGQRFYTDLLSKLRLNLLRPLKLLFTRPIIPFIGLMYALQFGIYTLMLSTFAVLWIERYHQSATIASLHYIAIAAGIWLSAQIGGPVMDWCYKRLCLGRSIPPFAAPRPCPDGKPEFRAPYMFLGGALMPVGLLWYGWAVEQRGHWIAVDLGALVFTFGGTMFVQGALAYVLDEFGSGSASAGAGTRVMSQLFGFGFPIFAPQMYGRLGYGWGNSVLAGVALVCAVPLPLVLWFWGERLRAVGRERQVDG